MAVLIENNETRTFEELAEATGLAIALADAEGTESYTANNNSICRELNPAGVFTGRCLEFCGRAASFVKSEDAGHFECHAGLECGVVPVQNAARPLVAIVGRAFVRSESYRAATERAITGDWRAYSPVRLFDNVLLAASGEEIIDAARRAKTIIDQRAGEKAKRVGAETPHRAPDREKPPEIRDEDLPQDVFETKPPRPEVERARAWRSFFGSILESDYPRACDAILRFISARYGLKAMVWLDRREGRLENTIALGELRNRKVRLGIDADDARLAEAAAAGRPLELGERSTSGRGRRTLSLFPIGVGDEITCAIAVLGGVPDDVGSQIVRICHSLASQIEILRLRSEIAENEALAGAVRRFGDGLKDIDTDDPWMSVLQSVAEMLGAERASLLIYDDKQEALAIKAVMGADRWTEDETPVGSRIARLVFDQNKPISSADISRSGLAPAPERGYRTSSFLSCPVAIGERVIGVINFTDRADGEAFDRRSLELYQSIAAQLAVALDRTSLKHKAGEFEQLSVTDPLTGLLNRRYMEARLAEEVKRSTRHGFPMSFMMLDVDHFKSYNDQFGHPAGDEALKTVGSVIRQTLRGADVAARFGGEEFSILLPQTTCEEAMAIGERIRHNIAQTRFQHRRVTTSIGVASCSAELCASAEMVSAADKALYEAKRRGRNRVLAFEEMNRR